jgi:hypothetical protein
MSYATACFYYGIPLVYKHQSDELKAQLSATLNRTRYLPETGFNLSFHDGDTHFFFAVSLDYQIDESNGFTDVAPLSHLLKEEHQKQYQTFFNTLSPTLQEEIKNYGTPKVFMVWKSS